MFNLISDRLSQPGSFARIVRFSPSGASSSGMAPYAATKIANATATAAGRVSGDPRNRAFLGDAYMGIDGTVL